MFSGKPNPVVATKEGFVAHTASHYVDEADANISWGGPNLPHIPTAKAHPHPPLDAKVQALIATTWKMVAPKEGAARSSSRRRSRPVLPRSRRRRERMRAEVAEPALSAALAELDRLKRGG